MKFKTPEEVEEITMLLPELLLILADMNLYCKDKLPFTITRMIDGRIPGLSVSNTHQEGRAFDVSVRGWKEADIETFTKHFNLKYSNEYGAYSLRDGLPRTVVYHNGTAPHFHIQIRPL